MTAAAVCAAAGAFAASYISGTETAVGTMVNEGNAYTASELVHASDMSSYNLPASTGWVAGIKLTWKNNQQNATQTTEEFGDSAGWRSQSSFTVYSNGDKTPSGSGLKNATTSSGSLIKTYYNSTAEWYVYVTPEMMYQWSKDRVETYTATLTVKETNRDGWSNVTTPTVYTITIPTNLTLKDGNGVAWYPAVGLLGAKVYGDAQLLANAVEPGNYQDVKFLVDPSELTFPNGFAADDEVDGVWGVRMLHNHSWSFNVLDGTNLVATCGAANCPYNNGEVRMWLNVGTTEKEYDGQSVTRIAAFDEHFMDVFPEAATVLTVNEVENGTINTAGVYTVALSVTGVGGDSEPYELSTTVTVSPVDITDATLVLAPSSTTYNGAEQTVVPSVTAGGVTATLDDGLVLAEGSCSATEIGEYTVTVNGTGNFTGTASATWEIKNTTGAMGGVAAASAGSGDVENNILTVADTTALEFSDGAWCAGLTLTWPLDTKDYSGIGQYGHAYYVTEESAKVTVDAGTFEHESATGSYRYNLLNSPEFTYLANTTWTVGLTPAAVEAALAENKTALEYTMRAGAIVSETYAHGVAFTDYTIAVSINEPVVFALGGGEAYDLGETVLTTTRIKLAPGASVTTTVQQTEDLIFIETPGYDVVWSENDGVYTYTTKFTHQHAWSFGVVDGTNLVATCGNDDCDMGGEVRMWLHVDATEKVYDGNSMTRAARYDDNFKAVFPGVSASVSVNGAEGTINDAGTYSVVMNVTGLGDGETHVLSTTVTVSPVDITGATLVLTPASTTYNAAEQTVTPSVTVGGLAATIEVAEGSMTAATEIGTYSVTVNGTGNFTGTTSGKWSIVNTTGEPTSVAASAAGSMTNVGNDFTLSDSSKLEYDSENKVWYAGITITWPVEKKDWQALSWTYHAYYVTEDSVRLKAENGGVKNATDTSSYKTGALSSQTKSFTYLSTTTWKVPLSPAIVEAAIAEEKSALTYTMNAGALIWGDDTEGDKDGVAFRDYTITIPLEGIKLYDENGHQVYPVQSEEDIVEEMKGAIDAVEGLDEGGKTAAKSKVEALVEAADGDAKEVRDWIEAKTGGDYGALADSDYIVASYALDTEDLITDESEVEVVGFETTDGGFSFAVTIDDGDVESARVKVAGIVQSATSLVGGEFVPLNAERIDVKEDKVTISVDPAADCEFFKIVIKKDTAE